MLYKLIVKAGETWRAVGFDFLSTEDAREEAQREWAGLPFLVIPEHLTG